MGWHEFSFVWSTSSKIRSFVFFEYESFFASASLAAGISVPSVFAMKRQFWWILLGWGLAWVAHGQVDLKLEIPQTQMLTGERIEVAVRISNFTGRTLTLGAETNWLRFQVEDRSGAAVFKLGEVPDSGHFVLQAVERGTLRFDIAPCFKLDQPGRYKVFALARIPGGEDVASPAASFELVRGTRLAQQPFGFDGPAGMERRKYVLHQANYLDTVALYVRVCDDTETVSYQVTRLGKTVSFTKPQNLLDAESRWHVLHQFGRVDYVHHVFRPDGTLETRQYHVVTDRRPELRVNDAGKVAVFGGARRLSVDDFPAPTRSVNIDPAPATLDEISKKR